VTGNIEPTSQVGALWIYNHFDGLMSSLDLKSALNLSVVIFDYYPKVPVHSSPMFSAMRMKRGASDQ
jgi:hypothetical protein